MREQLLKIRDTLMQYRLPVRPELDLQTKVHEILTLKHPVDRDWQLEYRIAKGDRLDIYSPVLKIAVECKVGGSRNATLQQVMRYAEFESIAGILVVSSSPSSVANIIEIVRDKPVVIVPAYLTAAF